MDRDNVFIKRASVLMRNPGFLRNNYVPIKLNEVPIKKIERIFQLEDRSIEKFGHFFNWRTD